PSALLPTAPSSEAPQGIEAGTLSPVPCIQSDPQTRKPIDIELMARNYNLLENSGWYWGAVTAAQAHSALQEASEGAFLVRDSSHPLYLLTLSVRTARGPTSIRIQSDSFGFMLDSSTPGRTGLSSFPNVNSLVQHYMGPEWKPEEGKRKVEDAVPSKLTQQKVQETSVVMKLKRALYNPKSLPSLQHLTRLVINRHTDHPDQLPLPGPLVYYLYNYPFKV
ncbi:unnamed protein product, partial [Menidia menidia]